MRALVGLLCGALLLALAGCAPSTAGGVRDLGPEHQTVFAAPENYQRVYRKLLDRERECYQAGLITAQMVVQGDIYTDTKSGVITVSLVGALGTQVYQVLDVAATDENHTKITGSFPRGSADQFGQMLRRWLEGSKECGLK